MRGSRWGLVVLLAAALVVVGAAGGSTSTTLPGGTALTVGISSPSDGAVLPQGPVVVDGDASVGTAAPVARTGIVVVLDVSGSTQTGGACGGNQNPTRDAFSNTTLDCELAAAKQLNDDAATAGTVGQIAVVPFASTAGQADLGPAGGAQGVVAPGADVDTSLASAFIGQTTNAANPCPGGAADDGFAAFSAVCVGTGTNYTAALTQTSSLLGSMTEPNKLVVFASDGAANLGGPITAALATIHVPVYTFAIGASASCPLNPSGLGSLQQIATATGGTCTDVNTPGDLANLPSLIPAVIASQLRQVTLALDGGSPLDLSGSTAPAALPLAGPTAVTWSQTYPGLSVGSHQFCAVSSGSDGGGSGTASECVNVTVNAAPTDVSATGGSGVEGSAIPISGAFTDPDGTDVVTWSYAPGAGVDAGASCSFGDASQLSTAITCTDDGTYDLTLKVDDGVNPAVTAATTVTVANAAPTAAIAPVAGVQAPGASVPLSATFTDAGANDTHTCSFTSGALSAAGSVTESPGACTGALTFPAAGDYLVTVTVTDDDGGSGTASTTVHVDTAPSCAAATATPATLWSPNHKFATITVSVPDPDAGDSASVHVDGVTQDEPVAGTGSGDSAPDARANAGAGKVDVRSERSGSGDGRVYRIAFTATDTFGASCSGTVDVSVPHDQGGAAAVAGPGPWVDSFGS